MGEVIDFAASKDYYEVWEDSQVETYIDEAESYFVNYVWDQIESDSVTTTKWYKDDLQIGTSGSYSGLGEKVEVMDDWLANNYSYYDTADCIYVLDYEDDPDYIGYSSTFQPGSYGGDRTCTVDYASDNLPSYVDDIKFFIGHEIGHVYGCAHSDAGVTSDYEATFVKDYGDDATCNYYSNPNNSIRKYSSAPSGSDETCNEHSVEYWAGEY